MLYHIIIILSCTNCCDFVGSFWKSVRKGRIGIAELLNCWEMARAEITLIWRVSAKNFQQQAVEQPLGLSWQIVCSQMVLQVFQRQTTVSQIIWESWPSHLVLLERVLKIQLSTTAFFNFKTWTYPYERKSYSEDLLECSGIVWG